MTLPKEVEEKLEAVLDEWLENFDVTANEAGDFLKVVGIEPTLETLLGYSVGMLDSLVGGFIHSLYDRGMKPEEDDALVELIRRKLPELERRFKAFLRGKKY
jgi:hypothetical protein